MKRKIKTLLSALIILVSAFCLAFGLAGCNTGQDDDGGVLLYTLLDDKTGYSVAIIPKYKNSVTEITIPSTYNNLPVTNIGNFYGCESLTNVTIPNSVTSIGNSAFYGCESLTNVTIPNSVTSIGNGAFAGCTSLTNIIVDKNNVYYKSIDGNLYSYDGATLIQYAIGKTVTELTIPASVTSISTYAFGFCTSLKSVTIPNSVTSIDDLAFCFCTSLTKINYNATKCSDLDNGDSAFQYAGENDEGITVIIGANVTKIPAYLFSSYNDHDQHHYPNKIVSVVFAENSVCESIGDRAFSGCKSLASVTIPDSVMSIGSYAFSGCTSLKYNEYDNASYLGNVTNPYVVLVNVKDTSITSFNINVNTKFIYNSAFENCTKLTSITIPDGVTGIGELAFYDCKSLASVTIPNSVMSIGSYAFEDCSKLTRITIPDSVTSIGNGAFVRCTSLTSITIPDSVTSIGSYAFEDCSKLTRITIPDSVTSIGIGSFAGCTSLTNIIVDENNVCYKSIDGDLYSYDGTTLIQYAIGKTATELTIPNSVTSIESFAFADCSKLTCITIPDSVTSIGNYAFGGCKSLASVTIPDGVTSIGSYAFEGCIALESITIPDRESISDLHPTISC